MQIRFLRRLAAVLTACAAAAGCLTVAAAPGNSASAAFVLGGDALTELYAKNADARLPMASTTKIMTALLVAEQPDLDLCVTVPAAAVAVEGTALGLRAGDRISLRGLLYGMLLASGNDAANVAAYALGGDPVGFAARMNEKAAALGLQNTHFVTPSGLDADGHYTSARDLALLAAQALRNPAFAEAAAAKTATLQFGNPPTAHVVSNHNRLLSTYPGAVGVKTGFTKQAGRCLVSAARRDGALVIAVTLHDPADWEDHRALLDYGFSCLQTRTLSDAGITNCPLVGGDRDSLPLTAENVTLTLCEKEWERLTRRVELPRFCYAPVKRGEKIGRVLYLLDGEPLAETPLCAAVDAAAFHAPPLPFFARFCRALGWLAADFIG